MPNYYGVMRAINTTKNTEIAATVIVADSVLKRLKGFLGKKKPELGEAVWLRPCKGIHTMGMRFPIDVIFLNKDSVVAAITKDLLPNRITSLHPRAASALEVSAGTLSATGTEVGDVIKIA